MRWRSGALLEIVRQVELSQESDGLSTDINMGSSLALGQALHLVRLRSQTVKPLGRVEEKVGL